MIFPETSKPPKATKGPLSSQAMSVIRASGMSAERPPCLDQTWIPWGVAKGENRVDFLVNYSLVMTNVANWKMAIYSIYSELSH